MAIKVYNPVTAARRGMTTQDLSEVTTDKPLRSLLKKRNQRAGRNNKGRITVRHRGGGVKRQYRLIDHSLAQGLEAVVEEIEYDPNRSARIARVKDQYGNRHYIIADTETYKGKIVKSGENVPVESSNRLPLSAIPIGSQIYAIELIPGNGAQIARAAGAKAQLMSREDGYAQVKLPSGEVRLIRVNATAAIGIVGNIQHQNVKLGSAGRKRKMGIRPSVRGVVMNAVDHPHGGGDGGRHGTGKSPRTPWGQLTIGYRTRHRKNTDKFIVKSRHENKREK